MVSLTHLTPHSLGCHPSNRHHHHRNVTSQRYHIQSLYPYIDNKEFNRRTHSPISLSLKQHSTKEKLTSIETTIRTTSFTLPPTKKIPTRPPSNMPEQTPRQRSDSKSLESFLDTGAGKIPSMEQSGVEWKGETTVVGERQRAIASIIISGERRASIDINASVSEHYSPRRAKSEQKLCPRVQRA